MAKTPKALREAIADYDRAVEYTEELIRVKTTIPVENQAQHVRDGSPEVWIARLEGQWVMLESMLHRAHCYAGFQYLGPKVYQLIEGSAPPQYISVRYSIGCDHPDFAPWRRTYFTKN